VTKLSSDFVTGVTECHAIFGDDTNKSNLSAGRVLKRTRTESHPTQLVEQERAIGDVNGNSSTLGLG
jgi:hypothetical protein